jgi:predicted small lipoprotein YifL
MPGVMLASRFYVHPMRFSRFSRAALAAIVSVGLLTACGQKGTLYLRDKPPAGVKIPKPAAPKPVPYPTDPAADPEKQD